MVPHSKVIVAGAKTDVRTTMRPGYALIFLPQIGINFSHSIPISRSRGHVGDENPAICARKPISIAVINIWLRWVALNMDAASGERRGKEKSGRAFFVVFDSPQHVALRGRTRQYRLVHMVVLVVRGKSTIIRDFLTRSELHAQRVVPNPRQVITRLRLLKLAVRPGNGDDMTTGVAVYTRPSNAIERPEGRRPLAAHAERMGHRFVGRVATKHVNTQRLLRQRWKYGVRIIA